MRINKEAIGKCCPTCWREIDPATVDTFEKEKIKLIKDGVKGPKSILIKRGRPRLSNEEMIHTMRAKGMPLEQIAVALGISVATVLRRLKCPLER